MKTFVLAFPLLITLINAVYAAPPMAAALPNLSCKDLTGFWEGTYSDPQNLFIADNFPIKLYLLVEKSQVLGYTLPANDQKGAGFGSSHYPTLIFGQCSNNMLTNLYVLPHQQKCGDPLQSQPLTFKNNILNLKLPWENAMTGTVFIATLTKVKALKSVNLEYLQNAQTRSQTKIQTCH